MKLDLKHCSVEWTPLGSTVSFPNGEHCGSRPHRDNFHYRVISHRLGYGDDVMAYCREHDLAHALLSEEFADGPPIALLETAKYGAALDVGYNIMEECTAHVLQRWIRANERPIIGNCDWDGLKARFLQCVERLEEEA